ncbi:MAG: FprA family A-type flavoprotein [bacterium]
MPAIEVKKDLYWVGAIDWNIRDFHGYSTEKGTTYNSYLVLDDKITLFDTVKKPFRSDLLHNIRRIIDPSRIDYVVINHVEMDHSGCLPEILQLIRPEKVFCSLKGKEALVEHFHAEDWPYEPVENGQDIRLGKRTVRFLETRMLHWPDSMFSYIPEDRLLISSDAFGQHWATSERFDDEVDMPELLRHAAKYFANILLPYSPLVQKLLTTVREAGIPIETIAPDHGLIWRSRPAGILEAYDAWSRQETTQKALVIYDTMWKSTEAMARAIAEGLQQEGARVKLLDLKVNHRSDVMTDALDAKALILGSSTLNNQMLPRMADMLTYLKGLKPRDRIGAAFGSYGWSGDSVKQINRELEAMKMRVPHPGISIKYVPDHEALRKCVEMGAAIGKAMRESGS